MTDKAVTFDPDRHIRALDRPDDFDHLDAFLHKQLDVLIRNGKRGLVAVYFDTWLKHFFNSDEELQ